LVSAWSLLQQATWFARRGWAALIVWYAADMQVRRQARLSYMAAGLKQSMRKPAGPRPRICPRRLRMDAVFRRFDSTRVVVIGAFTGGFPTAALTADAPAGLLAEINFAGGWGGPITMSAMRVNWSAQIAVLASRHVRFPSPVLPARSAAGRVVRRRHRHRADGVCLLRGMQKGTATNSGSSCTVRHAVETGATGSRRMRSGMEVPA
jgi:hypothetical protein